MSFDLDPPYQLNDFFGRVHVCSEHWKNLGISTLSRQKAFDLEIVVLWFVLPFLKIESQVHSLHLEDVRD